MTWPSREGISGFVTPPSEISSGQSSTPDVTEIVASKCAFAALLANGSVVSFGWAGCGGDSSSVRNTLSSHIGSVVANDGAFAALSSHGKAIVWGSSNHGGVLSEDTFQRLQSGVKQIRAYRKSFVALFESRVFRFLLKGLPPSTYITNLDRPALSV